MTTGVMAEAAEEEAAVLSAIYCGAGEFQLLPLPAQEGLMVQIQSAVGGETGPILTASFHLHPLYPTEPPRISVSSASLSRAQCLAIRQKLVEQAQVLVPEPMVHQLVQYLQCVDLSEVLRRTEEGEVGPSQSAEEEQRWAAVLMLDHIRSLKRYVRLLERWTQQLQLTVRLLQGPRILLLLLGSRTSVKEFQHLLKTSKVDVDSAGKKCKERMMTVLIERRCSGTHESSPSSFEERRYQSAAQASQIFQELQLDQVYQQIEDVLCD
ncbi:RWD domain-containing protein 3 [Synchiropus picturatus]